MDFNDSLIALADGLKRIIYKFNEFSRYFTRVELKCNIDIEIEDGSVSCSFILHTKVFVSDSKWYSLNDRYMVGDNDKELAQNISNKTTSQDVDDEFEELCAYLYGDKSNSSSSVSSNSHQYATESEAARAANISKDELADIVDGAISVVNDDDYMRNYNTPESFAEAVAYFLEDKFFAKTNFNNVKEAYPTIKLTSKAIKAIVSYASNPDVSGTGDFIS